MCLVSHVLFDFAIPIDEFDRAISKTDSYDVAGASAEGHPIVVDGVGVKI